MRILSWNVNGIRAVQKHDFIKWLAAESPDILCVQETKAEPGQLNEELKSPVMPDGTVYQVFWASARKKGYSGTAIFTKKEPSDVKTLGDAAFDDEGRVLQADFGDFILISAYFPNSQGPGLRLDYKLAFCDAMLDLCGRHVAAGRHIVLCGDYNIAHRPIDLARPDANEGNAGYLPEERAWFDKWEAAGWTDTFRALHPDEVKYSWWSYRMRAREKNIGWRIDYHCVDNAFAPAVKEAKILNEVAGSDHCPVELVLH
jgi:exodeoxyribonuclease-3